MATKLRSLKSNIFGLFFLSANKNKNNVVVYGGKC